MASHQPPPDGNAKDLVVKAIHSCIAPCAEGGRAQKTVPDSQFRSSCCKGADNEFGCSGAEETKIASWLIYEHSVCFLHQSDVDNTCDSFCRIGKWYCPE
eukprot:scaffold5088_cov98-Cylindrotheca_fusiformis.AAC.3